MTRSSRVQRYAMLSATVALAITLVVFALRTYHELAEMQHVYLHDRASMLADRLERLAPEEFELPLLEKLRRQESTLAGLRFYREQQPLNPPQLQAIWSGRLTSLTEEVTVGGQRLFRAWMPFRSGGVLQVARIDLDLASADFLLTHARRNLLVASFSGVSLLMLALWAAWSARHTAQLQKRQLELEHLAHLGQMSAILAHEIRNPLGTIKGFAQLACEKAEPRIVALLDPVLNEIGRLEKLVKDLLLYSKPSRPAVRWVEWTSVCAELKPFVAEAIGNAPLRFRLEGNELEIETDPDVLKEVLLNLLRNSVEALAPYGEGEVRLSAEAGPPLRIAVEDNGPGMEPAVNEHLFEPFYTTKAAGTGLGLNVARKLAESLGAALSFQALQPHGTRAELRFAQGKVKHGTYPDRG